MIFRNLNKDKTTKNTMSKITVLGTAGNTDALSKRSSGGILIEIDESQILINPGVGCIVRSSDNNIDLKKTNIILISSDDLIDCNDLEILSKISNAKIINEKTRLEINGIDIEAIEGKKLSFKIFTSKFILSYISTKLISKQFMLIGNLIC